MYPKPKICSLLLVLYNFLNGERCQFVQKNQKKLRLILEYDSKICNKGVDIARPDPKRKHQNHINEEKNKNKNPIKP